MLDRGVDLVPRDLLQAAAVEQAEFLEGLGLLALYLKVCVDGKHGCP